MNISIKAGILPVALLNTVAMTAANDSIVWKRQVYSTGHVRFRQEVLASPAMRNYLHTPSISEFSVYATTEPAAAARIPQLGRGGKQFGMEASSFQQLGANSVVWGKASYQNGKKYDVTWNETSDFLLLYPYVMGDAKGGDQNYESYRLDGGYSTRHGKTCYGVDLGYRTLSEYRDRDPRPNNTVADLYAQGGIGLNIWGSYSVAVTATAEKYKQTNELAFYNELGTQMVYHLTGIGNDFTRFSGQGKNCFYKGYSIGAEISMASKETTGWSASAGYLFTRKEKVLTDLNRLPLNRLEVNSLDGAVGYNNEDYGVRLTGNVAQRKGIDNLFGDATGNIYPQIGSRKQYDGKIEKIKAEGFWNVNWTEKTDVNIEPEIACASFKNSHHTSGNLLKSSDLTMGVTASIVHANAKNMVCAKAKIRRRENLAARLDIYNCQNELLAATLQNIKEYMGGGETEMSLAVEYTFKIWKDKALTAATHWRHTAYHSGNSNFYMAKLTISL